MWQKIPGGQSAQAVLVVRPGPVIEAIGAIEEIEEVGPMIQVALMLPVALVIQAAPAAFVVPLAKNLPGHCYWQAVEKPAPCLG